MPKEGDSLMDVRSIEGSAPIVEHNGTVPVWYLFEPQELRQSTEGGFLELVNEFEVAGGSAVYAHQHPTHEWYYVTSGRGIMTVADEDRDVQQGDLVYIPPDTVHSLRPISDNAPIHCFCFAIGVAGIGKLDYSTHE
jgi:quercetin dioxygenase-like cupin family protein